MKLPSYKEARSRKKEKVVIEEYKMPKSISKVEKRRKRKW